MTMVRSLFTFNKDALEVEFAPKMKNVSVWASLVALTIKICLQCRRPGFSPCIGKITWRRGRKSRGSLERLMPLGWTSWISLLSKGLSRVFSNATVQKHQFFSTQLFFILQISHPYMTTGKTKALTR